MINKSYIHIYRQELKHQKKSKGEKGKFKGLDR